MLRSLLGAFFIGVPLYFVLLVVMTLIAPGIGYTENGPMLAILAALFGVTAGLQIGVRWDNRHRSRKG